MKVLLTLFLLLISVNSYSQCNCGLTGFAGLGISYSNVIKDDYATLPNLMFSLGYVQSKDWMYRLDYQYVRFKNVDEVNTVFEEVGDIGKLTTHIFKFGLYRGDFTEPKPLRWYGGINIGTYNVIVEKKIGSVEETSSKSKFGIGVGVGISYKVAKSLRLFLEGQANAMFGSGKFTHFFPLMAGLNYDFMN